MFNFRKSYLSVISCNLYIFLLGCTQPKLSAYAVNELKVHEVISSYASSKFPGYQPGSFTFLDSVLDPNQKLKVYRMSHEFSSASKRHNLYEFIVDKNLHQVLSLQRLNENNAYIKYRDVVVKEIY